MMNRKRFGDYAVEMGFCSPKDVERAVEIQTDLIERGHPRMLIGLVMVRYGIIANTDLVEILKVLEQEAVESILAS